MSKYLHHAVSDPDEAVRDLYANLTPARVLSVEGGGWVRESERERAEREEWLGRQALRLVARIVEEGYKVVPQ